jgi:hypothetical protein
VRRQIRLTKKLIEIIGTSRPSPVGIAVGLSLKELRIARSDFSENQVKESAYFLCMCECLNHIGQATDECFPSERVMVIHDASKEFDKWALEAYQQMFVSLRFPYTHCFVSIAPGSWTNFPALQPADLIAYEGFKLTAARKRGSEDLRKSLQSVIGHGVVINAGFYKPEGVEILANLVFS